jgi:hypothetical protein
MSNKRRGKKRGRQSPPTTANRAPQAPLAADQPNGAVAEQIPVTADQPGKAPMVPGGTDNFKGVRNWVGIAALVVTLSGVITGMIHLYRLVHPGPPILNAQVDWVIPLGWSDTPMPNPPVGALIAVVIANSGTTPFLPHHYQLQLQFGDKWEDFNVHYVPLGTGKNQEGWEYTLGQKAENDLLVNLKAITAESPGTGLLFFTSSASQQVTVDQFVRQLHGIRLTGVDVYGKEQPCTVTMKDLHPGVAPSGASDLRYGIHVKPPTR